MALIVAGILSGKAQNPKEGLFSGKERGKTQLPFKYTMGLELR